MRIVDCHVHLRGEVDPSELLAQLDANQVDRTIILSMHERHSLEETREKLLAAKPALEIAPDRISGLAWVNPAIEGMADLAAEAVEKMGYIGIKIMPDHWYAYEERLQPFWKRMDELAAPILFHTGILYGWEDNSRFCKPLWLEALAAYPNIRFAMAHISWPWCEECLAVMGRFRAETRGGERQWRSYVDLTPGTPPHIRRQAVANAIDFCGAGHIMFGTDANAPGKMDKQKSLTDEYLRLLDELNVSEEDTQRIMAGTADEVFPPRT